MTKLRNTKKAKKPTKQKSARGKEITVWQGQSSVGYKCPPEEHKFQPGQSGNPNGPPKRRTHLWVWICKYMDMTDAQLQKLKQDKLTQAQQSALRIVENMKSGKGCGSERLARYIVDREEGKAAEHLIIDRDNDLTDEECEQLRGLILRNHANVK